jgi:hypothetical protein
MRNLRFYDKHDTMGITPQPGTLSEKNLDSRLGKKRRKLLFI